MCSRARWWPRRVQSGWVRMGLDCVPASCAAMSVMMALFGPQGDSMQPCQLKLGVLVGHATNHLPAHPSAHTSGTPRHSPFAAASRCGVVAAHVWLGAHHSAAAAPRAQLPAPAARGGGCLAGGTCTLPTPRATA